MNKNCNSSLVNAHTSSCTITSHMVIMMVFVFGAVYFAAFARSYYHFCVANTETTTTQPSFVSIRWCVCMLTHMHNFYIHDALFWCDSIFFRNFLLAYLYICIWLVVLILFVLSHFYSCVVAVLFSSKLCDFIKKMQHKIQKKWKTEKNINVYQTIKWPHSHKHTFTMGKSIKRIFKRTIAIITTKKS